ncbi:MAG: ABC transporter substrate-binding protein, partial [Clostridia bacterium]|nr:ABC transporter substrate-binding protein [Clostridia bacterium]
MKKLLAVLLAGIMLLSFASCGKDNDTTDKDTFTVGICQLTKHTALDAATQGFIDALKAEFGDKVNILNENASGDAQTCTTIVNNFVNKNVDLIMANATPALQAAVNGTDTIPILGTSVTEYGTALGIKNFSGTVGGNVSGTSDLAPLDQQANMITELFPSAKTVAILFCSAEANSRYQVDVVKAALQSKGLAVDECSFTESNDVNAAATRAAGSDVIYIPTDNKAADCATLIA